ncbi:hypothetical protein [Cyprinid herpesvirus 3]|uniref:Uncharacterized protein n=1 Tax=Cyprinid herpesvirus 3 TaxID=180230 RepID=A3QMM9_CYHV3|nr:hypothetical protein [Cyprinid herpesvirus 3]AVL27674.1 protein Allo54 [Cyprinid herpesvirus 3]
MGIRSAGVFTYLNTARWLRALGVPTGPKTLRFKKADSRYGCCILDLTLTIHTICLSQASEMNKYNGMGMSMDDAVDVVLDKIRGLLLAKLKATNLVVFCLDSMAGGLKFAVSAQRAHHREAWDDSLFVSMLKDSRHKANLFARIVEYVGTLELRPKQTVVILQRHDEDVEASRTRVQDGGDGHYVYGTAVTGVGGRGWFHMASGSASTDEDLARLRALFQKFLEDTDRELHYESDMLCFQVAEMLPERGVLGCPNRTTVLIESKDTDMAAILVARYGSSCERDGGDSGKRDALARSDLLFRSYRKFVDVDMDASLSLALCWVDVGELRPAPFVSSDGRVNGCPDPAAGFEGERDALLWLLDFDSWTPLVDEFCVPVDGIKAFLEDEVWYGFLRTCARTFTRGPLFRRTLLYMSSCMPAEKLEELCRDVAKTGQPVYELVTASLGLSNLRLQNDGFCTTKDGAFFTFAGANKAAPAKDKRQSVASIMDLTHLLYASGRVPLSSYQRYCEERYKMVDDTGVCMSVDPEATAAACCGAAVGLSMYGTDYTNGLPSVGEKQATAALCVQYLFRELCRFSTLSLFGVAAGDGDDNRTLLGMVSRFFGVSPRPSLTESEAANLMRHLTLPYKLWTEDRVYADLKERVAKGDDLSDVCVEGATLVIVNIKNDFQTTRGRPHYSLRVEDGEPFLAEPTHTVNRQVCGVLDKALGQLDLKVIRDTAVTVRKSETAANGRKRAPPRPKADQPRLSLSTRPPPAKRPSPEPRRGEEEKEEAKAEEEEEEKEKEEEVRSRFFQPQTLQPQQPKLACSTPSTPHSPSTLPSTTKPTSSPRETTSSSRDSSACQTSWVPVWMTARKRM